MKLEFYPEVCCEECNEVVHNHFDCPVCDSSGGFEGTSMFHIIDEEYYHRGDGFSCEDCDTEFILDTVTGYDYDEWEWTIKE